ncbi:LPXTG cell wall anchor domain-containing protein [Streptomyces sp. NPDC044948]|uniref:LPXTG cell wall anchor domain-containing protein n=1 Tax=Streptomyces sp. NPDC044948 TaxID=3157092 RepID=UPI0033F613E5
MKLRRAMVTAAAATVLAPLALVSAPVAFATDGPSTSTSSEEQGPATQEGGQDSSSKDETTKPSTEESPSSEEQPPGGNPPAGNENDPSDDKTTPSDDKTTPSDGQQPPKDDGTGVKPPSEDDTKPSDDAGKPSGDEGDPSDENVFDPYEDCDTYELDEKLSASISGLPNKIVAGSGWHDFEFVIDNDSQKDLKNVWINAFAEYSGELNSDVSLYEDLAEFQVKQNGKWTSAYQETYGDGKDAFTFTGSIVAILPTLEKDSTATLDLRVKIHADAPAGSAFSVSDAVYAGEDKSCYGNGDTYDFTVLAAGSAKPGDVDDVEPNGEKPKDAGKDLRPQGVDKDLKPQGGAKPVTGSLAQTGSNSALPMIGLVGGLAVVAGGGALFVVRRRKAGVQA